MKQKLILLFSTIIVCILISEAALIFFIEKDLDNNKMLNNLHLKPFQLPVVETKIKIDKLLDSNYNNNYQNVRLVHDTLLGWAPNPNFISADELYHYDLDGIRISKFTKANNEKKSLRIAIFGDSYIHGDEVNFMNTIGKFLEDIFHQNNVEVEVLNFALSGYGMDQALLRYKSINNKYKPDIVLLGVQFENIKRHINILRPFYSHITEIPYSKPRFIFTNGEFKLLSNPITDISKIIAIIKDFGNWEIAKYESFYNKNNYEPDILNFSQTYSAFNSLITALTSEFDYYSPNSESYLITKFIINEFIKRCNQNQQIFIPVHLPTSNDLDFFQYTFFKLFYSQKYIYNDLFLELKKTVQFIETFDKLKNWSSKNSLEKLFMKRHYSPIANKIIAEQIFKYIVMHHSKLVEDLSRY